MNKKSQMFLINRI